MDRPYVRPGRQEHTPPQWHPSYTIEASNPKKKNLRVSTVVVYTFFFPVRGVPRDVPDLLEVFKKFAKKIRLCSFLNP